MCEHEGRSCPGPRCMCVCEYCNSVCDSCSIGEHDECTKRWQKWDGPTATFRFFCCCDEAVEWTPPNHDEGCIKDHDPADGECYTRDDARADAADREYDRMKDGD